MKILLGTFILIISLGACYVQDDDKLAQNLDLAGEITIRIKSVPQSENVLVKLGTYHSFPSNDVSLVQDTLKFDSNEIYIKGPCRTPGRSFLHIGNSTYEVFGGPGDTIGVNILSANEETTNRPIVSFEGKNKEIQRYYQAKDRVLDDPVQACMNEGMKAANLAPFQKMMDKTYKTQYEFWEDYQKNHPLPDWFRTYETNVLNYTDAWLRVYMVWYQTIYQKKAQVIPESYYAFKSRIKVKDEAIKHQYEYLRFVREQLFWQMRQSNKKLGLDNLVAYARQELGENLGSFFEIWELSGGADNPNRIDEKYNKQFPAQHQYLVDYVQNRSKANIKLLKSGDKAPNFALVDLNDSLVTLDQYNGHVVYLSFWFTTCGPCIKEIPFENKLVEQFKDKPVKIISICTGTPGAEDDQQILKWRAASERFGLKTIDIFSNRAWTNTLAKNYMVSVYPHYVLIGADGKIIENFTDRPSQGVASKIERVLVENGK